MTFPLPNNSRDMTEALNDYIQSSAFQNYICEQVSLDELRQFATSFKIIIVDRDDERGGDFNEVILNFHRARSLVKSKEDLLEQFLHDSLHEMAWRRWQKCSVPYLSFSEHEADVIDEIWNQTMVYKYLNHLHWLHIDYVNRCVEFAGGTPEHVADVVALFDGPTAKSKIDKLSVVKNWLYQQPNPSDQSIFSTFIKLCECALKDISTKQAIIRYNENLNGINL